MPSGLPRRQFVKGVAVGGALLGLGLLPTRLFAAGDLPSGQPTLRGRRFSLTIVPQTVNFTGRERVATAVNGSVPGPILRWREGDRVTLDVTNRLAESSSIHWHGIILPARMDGVPDISFNGISSGLANIEAGLRLRYEIRREFAPYIGLNWTRLYGQTADFARAKGADINDTQFVFGVRAWF